MKTKNLIQIKDSWNNIYRLSKVILKDDLKTNNLNNKITLKAGTYFISGFWAYSVGLSKTLKDARELKSECLIPSINLSNFYINKSKLIRR